MPAKSFLMGTVCVGLLMSTAAAREVKKNFRHVFDAEPGAELLLASVDGDVEIRPWEKTRWKLRSFIMQRYSSSVGGPKMSFR